MLYSTLRLMPQSPMVFSKGHPGTFPKGTLLTFKHIFMPIRGKGKSGHIPKQICSIWKSSATQWQYHRTSESHAVNVTNVNGSWGQNVMQSPWSWLLSTYTQPVCETSVCQRTLYYTYTISVFDHWWLYLCMYFQLW